jgi:hypothetical protein
MQSMLHHPFCNFDYMIWLEDNKFPCCKAPFQDYWSKELEWERHHIIAKTRPMEKQKHKTYAVLFRLIYCVISRTFGFFFLFTEFYIGQIAKKSHVSLFWNAKSRFKNFEAWTWKAKTFVAFITKLHIIFHSLYQYLYSPKWFKGKPNNQQNSWHSLFLKKHTLYVTLWLVL